MKKQIFLYLFLFALLVIVFQFMNAKRKFEQTEQEIAGLKTEVDDLEHQNDSLQELNTTDNTFHFTLSSNDKSRDFFQSQGVNPDSLAARIENALISKNRPYEDNPLVPYASSTGNMRINKVQVLNNRWAMVEFTDTKKWGEALISYYIKDNGELAFETLDGVLYP